MPARLFRISPLLASLALAAAAHAQSRFEEDFDDKDKQWQEIAVQLPPAPLAEHLAPFYVSATSSYSFAVDTRSLTLGQDGVVRYTLVAVSDAGARNVSYEGIRCATYERKLYAFGQPDGSWSRSRRDQWERINGSAANRQHAALAKDYFCSEKTVAGSANDMVRRLRYQQTLEPQRIR
ncbi:MAG TPA: CNP1-like family protein [Noviherbaspirillum sp.]|uniref:CNP1-like family protein n=1 Tax=Noviherbaspirillum sp. TaxID=1926288 RepID=UPI002D425E66|nr:CNP1-like family protein [Noviherbaspirillum sp.]HYD95656.1 CNP1-like family protein [Noviherbaspirillum sp.]